MQQVKFCRRIGVADIYTNPYYNDSYYVQGRSKKEKGDSYQCVYWAYQRAQEIAEGKVCYFGSETKDDCLDQMPMLNRKGIGNGCEFFRDALWPKSVDNPQVGDIVCYGSGWGGGYGHVRVIEAIDDEYIYMSGANENCKGNIVFNIRLARSKAVGGGYNASGLQGFIHNPHILTDEEKEPTVDYKALYEEQTLKLQKVAAKLNEALEIINAK